MALCKFKFNLNIELGIIEEIFIKCSTQIQEVYPYARWSKTGNTPLIKRDINNMVDRQLYPYYSIIYIKDIVESYLYYYHSLEHNYKINYYKHNLLCKDVDRNYILNIHQENEPNILTTLMEYHVIDITPTQEDINILASTFRKILNVLIGVSNNYVNHKLSINIDRNYLELVIEEELGSYRYKEAIQYA